MSLQKQIVAELHRRSALLPQQITQWKERAGGRNDDIRIDPRQIQAVELLLNGQQEKLVARLDRLRPGAAYDDFAVGRRSCEVMLTGLHGILAIFRTILDQRTDKFQFHDVLRTADWVAAQCYLLCIRQAQAWQALDAHQNRVAPLTFLNARHSPSAFTRRHAFNTFDPQLRGFMELKLPIPVLSLPIHHTPTLWNFCSLYHEVGHLVDQDLDLTTALQQPLLRALRQAGSRSVDWQRWLREIIADTFGLMLGGIAFAYTLADLLLLPTSDVTRMDIADEHPPHYLRLFLLGTLMRQIGHAGMAEAAAEVETLWSERYGLPTPELAPYMEERTIVAAVVIDEPLAALQSHRLLDLCLAFTGDLEAMEQLGTYLLRKPAPELEKVASVRLLPAAAQLVMWRTMDGHAAIGERIHTVALRMVALLPRHEAAAPPLSTAQIQYLQTLVQDLDFEMLLQ